jgi:hypothetical protein
MRTLRMGLAGTVTLVLVASLSGTVAAQDEEPAPITFVTGWVFDQSVHTEVRDWEDREPDPPNIVRGYEVTSDGRDDLIEESVAWSDPRLPTEHWVTLRYQSVSHPTEEEGALTTATSHLLVDEAGSWSGTGRMVEDGRSQLSFYELTGEGAYEGLHALLWGPGVNSPGPMDIAYEGYIFEGDLLPFPEAPVPVTTEAPPTE